MPKIRFTIDGREVECEQGTMVVQAALDAGVFIPHYCYHPALSVAGNCRMCMVEVVPKVAPGQRPPPPKPVIGCATEAVPGMEVLSASPLAVEARKGVLESLLINHPLDCPVCDQAGECDLQDFSFQYGQGESRFREEKAVKHTKDLGPEVRLYGNRCINCTRCVRFSQEISGTSDIIQVNRGGHNVVDVFPGTAFDNPLSGNVVDICPVGALVSRDFLHKARVWQLDATPSVCPHCSTGCSIEVHTRDEEVMRVKPRWNPAVNGYWMCDTGRLGYKHVHSPDRQRHYERGRGAARERTTFQGAVRDFAEAWQAAGAEAYAIASTWMTNEELYLLRAIVPVERIALITRADGQEQRFFPRWGDSERNPSLPLQRERGKLWPDGATFVIEADKNPNTRGARAILGEAACSPGRLTEVLGKAARGEVKALLVVSGIPDIAPSQALVDAVRGAPGALVADLAEGALAAAATLVAPLAASCEQEGTFTNGRGTTQRLHVARPTVGHARPLLELLYALGLAVGREQQLPGFTAKRVFAALARTVEGFRGLDWDQLAHQAPEPWSPHQAARNPLRIRKLPMLPALPSQGPPGGPAAAQGSAGPQPQAPQAPQPAGMKP